MRKEIVGEDWRAGGRTLNLARPGTGELQSLQLTWGLFLELPACPLLPPTVIPAADLSEQISTAGTEASGWQHEIHAQRGSDHWHHGRGQAWRWQRLEEENFFIFGMRVEDVERLDQKGVRLQS